jgi:hypothetical protein
MPLLPHRSGPRKDRNDATTKKGGSRSYRPFELYSAVIPGRREATNYDAQSRIGE